MLAFLTGTRCILVVKNKALAFLVVVSFEFLKRFLKGPE
jgi:hypothetical protein